jgi:hypothetical protein
MLKNSGRRWALLVAATGAAGLGLGATSNQALAAPGGGARASKAAESSSRVENPLFSYTHLLPSPFTLPAGTLVLGTEAAFGLTDFLQVSTNIVSDFLQVFNAQAKVSLLDYQEFALAVTGGWQSYNRNNFDSSAPSQQITSWLPGVVAGVAVAPTVAWFVGANLNYTSQTIVVDNVPISGYFRGAQVESDINWAYYQTKSGNTNVLAAGVSYDITYKIFGVGLSHYFKNFKLGVHYYPNSTREKFLPIISGSAAISL